jgi:hypothetical protein
MPINIKNYKLALIGLIILFAVSMVMAGGGKPKIEKASANLRPLSASEIMGILQNFPEMVPGFLKDDVFSKKDTLRVKRLFRFSELDNSLLKQIFSTARFYRGFDGKKPPHPYLMAVVGNKRYSMPSNFNRLLLEHNLEVNDKNIIELAKAFVIIALEGKEITFLEGKRSVDKKKTPPIYRVHLKVRVNDEIQIYGFNIQNGQIQWATMNVEGKTATKYFDLEIIEEPSKRGELDLQGQINIATASPSKAYVEWENTIPHYYLIVESNGQATNDPVKFELSGEIRGHLPYFSNFHITRNLISWQGLQES